jgi:thiamine-monophosphate kinase
VGIGDDCAVVVPQSKDLLLCSDMLVEHTHFETSYFRASDIGFKSVVVNLSDIAAMGGIPKYVLCAVSGPKDFPIDEVLEGVQMACYTYNADLVGGDISRSTEIVVTISVVGTSNNLVPMLRSKAAPGDSIVITGPTGRSSAGLRSLSKKGQRPEHPSEVELAHLRPKARVTAGRVAAEFGTKAAIDISDGLALDLHRVADASGVGFQLERVPFVFPATAEDALFGGEDYELLLFHPDGELLVEMLEEVLEGTRATVIGKVVEDPTTRDLQGEPLLKRGYLH